jgi:hypothetical protein
MLRSKKLEIRKSGPTGKKGILNSVMIEPNPLKDRDMHEGDNPSF